MLHVETHASPSSRETQHAPREISASASQLNFALPSSDGEACDWAASQSRYVPMRVLGRGPETKVFEAYDLIKRRFVALKEVRRTRFADRTAMRLRWAHTRQMAQSRCPDVVRVYAIHPSRGWIVEERMSGSLLDRLARHRLPAAEVELVLRDALRALASLHRRGLVHGGVKIENLLWDARGRVKLASSSGAAPNVADPSRRHVAPELIHPERFGPPGPSVDLYALGFAMLELLLRNDLARRCEGVSTGRRQYREWFEWHRNPGLALSPTRILAPEASESLGRAIDGMIAKPVCRRFRRAADVLAALEGGQERAWQGRQAG